MPRAAAVSVENNFTKGLITEVTGVNSPEDSVTESLDVVFDRRGRASYRKGFDFESDFVFQTIPQTGVYSEFVWETLAGNNSVELVVIQSGYTLSFFESAENSPLSAGLKSFSVDLRTFKVASFSDNDVSSSSCSFATGKGYLFVAHPNCDTFYVKYDYLTDTISSTKLNIKIRDFEGVVDTVSDVTDRPVAITTPHKYNLYNQGWYAVATHAGGGATNVLDWWHTSINNYPSNVDFWWYYTTPDTAGSNTGTQQFNPLATVGPNTALLGNTPAPRGHYIINALETNRSALSGISGVTESSSNGYRPSVVAFFAGRVFYGGVGAPGFGSTVYFSQIIERDDQLASCYQLNDPTSKDYFDLLDSDGGTIKIQDMTGVIDMRVIGQQMFVFATNGVWSISGTTDAPFKATDYTISKVSSYPAISRTSIVDVGGLPLWWNYEGIFALQKSQIGLVSQISNLSQSTIQTFYDAIPQQSKLAAKGSYNDQDNLIYWLYSDNINAPSSYTRILVLDALTNAFYPLSTPVGDYSVTGIIPVRSFGTIFEQDSVVTNASDLVITSGSSQVYINIAAGVFSKPKTFKFVTVNGSNLTFSEISSDQYVDFPSSVGLTYSPYFITGYRIRGDLLKQFETNYLTIITEDIDNASCYVQGLWDYSDSDLSCRFTNPQQAYRTVENRRYQRSRLRMRGSGYSLQFKFFGEAGRPFIVVGWAGFETSDQLP